MNLSKNQFDILSFLTDNKEKYKYTQREIAKHTGLSVGLTNKTLLELQEMDLLEKNYTVGSAGLSALEPYRVKRILFIAAGFGSRMMPITLNTPKPLVRVKGKRIIDRLIDAAFAAGIEDITIVRGYLAEQFDQLLYQYPMIKFIENPIYNEANNISSVMCARYQLQNTYISEADLLLYNPKLIQKYQYQSNYLGIPMKRSDDWCFQTKNDVITKMAIGGENCYQMVGLSYWNAQDGAKLAEHVKLVYESPGGKERFWDQVALEYYLPEYKIHVRPCEMEDIVEIDSYKELQALDNKYK